MNLILFGAPGVGKGTQAELLSKYFNIAHISTGDVLRDAIKKETELGIEAKKFMDAGNLVPDEVMIGLVKEILKSEKCANGFILDGFPRTIPQAEALKDVFNELKISEPQVINIEVSEIEIIKRLTDRFICKKCGKVFNSAMLKTKENCPSCNGELYQRIDDKPETVKKRLDVYKNQTEPLKKYYSDLNLLKNVNGVGTIEIIQSRIIETLK